MKICIKKNEFNPSFIALYGEEKAEEQGYTIVEHPQGCEDCAFEDFNEDYTFDIEKYNKRKQRYVNQEKLIELTNWFNTTYRYKIEKYTRLIALEKPDDDGISAETKLKKLYEEAEEKRYKIQELEKN